MKTIRRVLTLLLAVSIAGCATSPPIRYFSLDDGQVSSAGVTNGLRVAIRLADLPEIIDRPQLVVRTAGHHVQLSELNQWAEPLRRQMPRLLARYLGEALDSGHVLAQPADVRDFNADFKVTVDIQRLETVAGTRVEFDAPWRAERRDGQVFFGRSSGTEPVTGATPNDYPAIVAAQSRALRRVAVDIAAGIVK